MNIDKVDSATIQLKSAIELFYKSDFVSAITLAGAAEEIFGKIAINSKGVNAIDIEMDFEKELAPHLKQKTPDRRTVIKSRNRVRNELKHNDSGDNPSFKAEIKYEAECIIERAIRNYLIAFDQLPKDKILLKFIANYWI